MMMWLLDNREFTWVKVTEALGKVGKQELARKLCEKHGIIYATNPFNDCVSLIYSITLTLHTITH